MKHQVYLVALAALSATAFDTAYAARTMANDVLTIPDTTINLTQAINVAEQRVGGKATRAELEQDKNQWVFDVEVVQGKKVMEVKVDSTSGKVIAASEDKLDHDDDCDRAD